VKNGVENFASTLGLLDRNCQLTVKSVYHLLYLMPALKLKLIILFAVCPGRIRIA